MKNILKTIWMFYKIIAIIIGTLFLMALFGNSIAGFIYYNFIR